MENHEFNSETQHAIGVAGDQFTPAYHDTLSAIDRLSRIGVSRFVCLCQLYAPNLYAELAAAVKETEKRKRWPRLFWKRRE